jgi:hypothetical protein
MKKEYVHTGQCIWCKRRKPEASFYSQPHIIPKSAGGTEIGFDVCDDCNHFFGTAKRLPLNTNLVFKEFFHAASVILFDKYPNKRYETAYFQYNWAHNKVRLKRNLSISRFTEQLKRSLFEAFLQKYHKTFPDEPLDKFEAVRRYTRYGEGNLNVYYILNEAVLICDDDHKGIIPMNENCKQELEKTGYYTFIFMGYIIFLEVLPITSRLGGALSNLQKIAEKLIIHVNGTEAIYQLNDFRDLDMFFERLSAIDINPNHNLRI